MLKARHKYLQYYIQLGHVVVISFNAAVNDYWCHLLRPLQQGKLHQSCNELNYASVILPAAMQVDSRLKITSPISTYKLPEFFQTPD
jgi:hypothetical protein